MPPSRTQVPCPRCKQPLLAQIEQLFDTAADPGAKQRLLGGISNIVNCRACGYSGTLTIPIVYHDADKELLLTHFPPELGLPVNEQEKIIGPLITQVMNHLPAEKRKAYLLRPQSFLTYQNFIERILAADGITPEMLEAQQKKVALIERLLSASGSDVRTEIIKQEGGLVDADFFAIFSRLLDNVLASGQEELAQQMDAVQQQLMAETEYGRQVASQVGELQEAIKTLQASGKNLDREKLLDILIAAPNDDRLNALASLTRPGLDYMFFQSLTARIEAKSGDERKKLEDLRQKLLDITRQLDQRIEEEYKRAGKLLNTLLNSSDVQNATAEHLNEINDVFVQVINGALREASQKKDDEQTGKLQQIVSVLQKASTPPPELQLLEELMAAPDDATLNKMLEEHKDDITPQFASFVASILARTVKQAGEKPHDGEAEAMAKLETINRTVLRFSMRKNLQG